MSVAVGAVIAGRYEILDRIADGGMSTVYRARRLPDGLVVALKILRSQYAADREFLERFSREARAAEVLEHPNIVRVFESGRDSEIHFIAMEYVDGPDLKGRLRRVGPFDPRDAEQVGRAVCEALEYAHRQGIVHRDIKPQNILIAPDGIVKVADFGIARALAAVTITQPGTVLGTVQYLSPEQARGGAVGRASDLYALGAVLYELLTGRLPYEGDAPIAIVLKHLHDPPPRARAVRRDVPQRLESIVLKAMAKAPADRYRSARDMATDLVGETEFWRDVAEDDGTTRQFRTPPAAPGRRIMRVGPIQALVLVAGLIVGGVWSASRALNAYLTVPEVEMPALVGRTLQDAEVLAKAVGVTLEVSDRVNSPTVPVDVVISQDQPPGKPLKQGRRVGVTVSLGARLVTVPDLSQRSFVDAQLVLDAARLKLGTVQDGYDTVTRPGLVLRQDPAPGASVPVDTAVTLVISRGPPVIEMPDVVGRTLEEARRVLGEKGLVITHLRTVGTTQAAPGIVLEQAPSPGVSVRFGEVTIALTVSARPGEENAPPSAPVITAEPQPDEPERTPSPPPSPRESPRASPSPPGAAQPGVAPSPRLTASPSPPVRSPALLAPGQSRRTRIQIVVPDGGTQDVRIVVIDESGVRTVYQAPHAPGDRIDQVVRSQGYTIIQVYVGNRLVEEVRPP